MKYLNERLKGCFILVSTSQIEIEDICRKKENFTFQNDFFSKLLSIIKTRIVNIKNVLFNELLPVPLVIFHPTGEMQKSKGHITS